MVACLATAALRVMAMMPQPVAAPGQINHGFLDPYSLVHAAVGLLLSMLGFGIGEMLLITFGWELAERAFKDLLPAIFPHPTQDTLATSLGDILSALGAWYVYRRAAGRSRSLPGSRFHP